MSLWWRAIYKMHYWKQKWKTQWNTLFVRKAGLLSCTLPSLPRNWFNEAAIVDFAFHLEGNTCVCLAIENVLCWDIHLFSGVIRVLVALSFVPHLFGTSQNVTLSGRGFEAEKDLNANYRMNFRKFCIVFVFQNAFRKCESGTQKSYKNRSVGITIFHFTAPFSSPVIILRTKKEYWMQRMSKAWKKRK